MAVRLTAALILSAVAVAQSAAADWLRTFDSAFQVGMGGVVPSPSNPNRVYAFTGTAGWFLISGDGGMTWQQTREVKPFSAITCIAVDPLDRDTIYVSASSSVASEALYKSTDGGRSFVAIGGDIFHGSVAPRHLLIDPLNPNVIYAERPPICRDTCTDGGVVKSVDGGTTWSDTARADNGTFSMAIDPNDSSVVYVTGYDVPLSRQTGGLYRTIDGGKTWPSLYPGLSSIDYVATDARSRVYAIVTVQFDKPLLRSGDRAESFSRLQIPVPPKDPTSLGEGPWPNLTAVAPDPRRTETLYVSSTTHGLLVSYDDGATWQPLGNLPDSFVNTLTVASNGVVFAVARSGIYRFEPSPPRRRAARR